jgi:hypothetical protein
MEEAIIQYNDDPNADGDHMVISWKEIVRCKDCVFWQDNNDGYPHHDCKWREDETPDPDDYCSAGERK